MRIENILAIWLNFRINHQYFYLTILTVAFMLVQAGSSAFAQTASSVTLTDEEKAFLKAHPEITIASGESFDPFTIENPDGSISGFDVDIAHLVSERTGLKFRFLRGVWNDMVQRALNHEVDGMAAAIMSEERAPHMTASRPYVRVTSLVIVKKGNAARIRDASDLKGLTVAQQIGNAVAYDLADAVGSDVKVKRYQTMEDMVRAVVSGDVDYTVVDEALFYVANKAGLSGMIEAAFPLGAGHDLHFLFRNDRPELLSLFNKGLRAIDEAEMLQVRRKWFSSMDVRILEQADKLHLSPDELLYLDEKKAIQICLSPMADRHAANIGDQRNGGIFGSYIELFERKLGSAHLAVAHSSDAACDLTIMSESDAKDRSTTAFLRFPYAIATRTDQLYMKDLESVLDKTFAVTAGEGIRRNLEELYPSIRLEEVDSTQEGLTRLAKGDVFGYIDSSFLISRSIRRLALTNLKISGHTPLQAGFVLRATDTTPLLISIFQKLIGSLSPQESQAILAQWVSVTYETGIDYVLVWQVALLAGIILAISLYWTRRLALEKQRVEAALAAEREAIRQNLNFIDMISHEYRTPLAVLSSSLDILEETSPDDRRSVHLQRMRKSTHRLLNLFETSLKKRRLDSSQVQVVKTAIDLSQIGRSVADYTQRTHPDHKIIVDLDENECFEIKADPDLLNIALVNLLDNACKYSKPGSSVRLTFARTARDFTIEVIDQGMGIDAEEKVHVFEKYYRSSKVGSVTGSGVGLFLVKNIVELHGGSINLYAPLLGGTRVSIVLPESL